MAVGSIHVLAAMRCPGELYNLKLNAEFPGFADGSRDGGPVTGKVGALT